MEDKYKKLLSSINLIEPPPGLRNRILAKIVAEEKRLAQTKTWVFGSTALTSFGLSLWAVVYLIKSVQTSGFGQYFSLIFSENGTILTYWRELSLSLAESLPITSLIIFLTAVGFFIWSFANIMKKDTGIFNIKFN